MRNEMKPFLEEGIQKYIEAKDTVEAFEQAMGQLIVDVLRKRKEWSPLRKCRIGTRANPGGGRGGSGYWIWTWITGQSPKQENTDIDCGLWWNIPRNTEPIITEPVIYAHFYEPKRVVSFRWPKQKQGIGSFTDHRGKTYLYVPLRKPEEIERAINKLLDTLLKQLK